MVADELYISTNFNGGKEKIQQSFIFIFMAFSLLVLALVYYVKMDYSCNYVKKFIWLNSFGLHHSYVGNYELFVFWF